MPGASIHMARGNTAQSSLVKRIFQTDLNIFPECRELRKKLRNTFEQVFRCIACEVSN